MAMAMKGKKGKATKMKENHNRHRHAVPQPQTSGILGHEDSVEAHAHAAGVRYTDFVAEGDRSSLFNRTERSVWWLPRKPTLLYMYDVIARSQLLSSAKKWYILIPSGHWRVLFGYAMLMVATMDVYYCVYSLAFCGAPFVGIELWIIQLIFLSETVITLISAVPKTSGVLEFSPRAIAKHHLQNGSLIIDVICLLPVEFAWFRCWEGSGLSCYTAHAAGSYAHALSFQWLHLFRWAVRLRRCDTFRSVTETSNDGPLQIIKYVFLLFMVAHLAACIYFWASLSSGGDALVCDHRTLEPRPWTEVARALELHNSLDPWNQILAETDPAEPLALGQLVEPADDEEARRMAVEGSQQLCKASGG